MSRKRVKLGRSGEDIAAAYLERQGWIIVERNYQHRSGEIDIIARDGETLVFVEVRTRQDEDYGHPLESVVVAKQHQVSVGALHYLSRNNLLERDIRFDVVGILAGSGDPEISHVTGAFESTVDW